MIVNDWEKTCKSKDKTQDFVRGTLYVREGENHGLKPVRYCTICEVGYKLDYNNGERVMEKLLKSKDSLFSPFSITTAWIIDSLLCVLIFAWGSPFSISPCTRVSTPLVFAWGSPWCSIVCPCLALSSALLTQVQPMLVHGQETNGSTSLSPPNLQQSCPQRRFLYGMYLSF